MGVRSLRIWAQDVPPVGEQFGLSPPTPTRDLVRATNGSMPSSTSLQLSDSTRAYPILLIMPALHFDKERSSTNATA